MKRWWWLLFLLPLAVGLARLRFNVEVLDLLPRGVPAVEGIKLYQQHFSNARELIVTVAASDKEQTTTIARVIAESLRADTNRISEVTWQPPWLERPEQTAELIAHLWLNQPPEIFAQLAARLQQTNLSVVLAATREELTTTLSPAEIARLSYDPFGMTRLPESVSGAAQGFGEGEEIFSSPDGTFRILFVRARDELTGYRECTEWFEAVKIRVATAIHSNGNPADIHVGYTGRPAFVTEVSSSMKHDITVSVVGTSVIIGILFWFAHRRWKPMLWLLTLLGLILGGTLALGGLFFGTINVVSMGFAAILLGLAVDYAVVHYQEVLAHPGLSIPEIRRAIAPSIFWAAITTIAAFLVLNLGGLPGLAQLGSLVGLGVALSALVMIFAFLPPLFPDRMKPQIKPVARTTESETTEIANPIHEKTIIASTVGLILLCAAVLLSGLPKVDASADALQPRDSHAYASLNEINARLNQKRDPLWLVVAGSNESEVAHRLDAVQPVLNEAVSNGVLSGFTIPTMLWPRPEFQSANRATVQQLVSRRKEFHSAALTAGFSTDALGLTDNLLDVWQRASAATNVLWPTNQLSTWIFEKLVARTPTNQFAVGFLFPLTNSIDTDALKNLEAQLPRDNVWLAGWKLLGSSVLDVVQRNMWKLVLPMIGLVLFSLWLAFRRFAEIMLSLAVLLISGLCLMAVMRIMGWSWNLLNLMAVPLILGTGVDYSLFMQLALRRHHGDLLVAHRSVGRALLLCGGTAVSGFGSLGLSSNAGMASLGQVCAVGIAANMLLAVYLLPVWWKKFSGNRPNANHATNNPSSLYSARLWSAALTLTRVVPPTLITGIARMAATIYWHLAAHRREVVIHNLLPVLNDDRKSAEAAAKRLFQEFGQKLVDLWRYESGGDVEKQKSDWLGWEIFMTAYKRGKGVLIVTPHLGNWEFGAMFSVRHDIPLLVLTQAEPEARLTEIRQASRAQRGIETLVIGDDPFAFVEIIKRLQAGATVALLVDRPPATTAVNVELFGHPFQGSIAPAELARASGCAIVPAFIVRKANGYEAAILPEIVYDRAAIGDRASRIRLTQEILRAFEPAIRQHATQWYHFVPIWPQR